MIRGYIIANPGCHYSEIKKVLGIKNGTLIYHLSVLEKNGFIHGVNDGLLKRFYPVGVKTNTATRILNQIKEFPGITQKEIVKKTRLKQQTVSYNLKLMEREGKIRAEKEKREKHYYFVSLDKKDAFKNCPFCGIDFELEKTPNFCPYCKEKLR